MIDPKKVKQLTTRFESLNDKQKKEFAIEVREDLIEHYKNYGERIAANPDAAFKALLSQFGDEKLIEKGLDYAKPSKDKPESSILA